MEDLIVVGAGGLGREVAWLVERINQHKRTWNFLGFLDEADDFQGTEINGHKVLGKYAAAAEYPTAHFISAFGKPAMRHAAVKELERRVPGIRFATLIDPSAIISEWVTIGAGCTVCAGCILTVNITIGDHVVINLDSIIGHDASISDFATIYPSVNLSGKTTVGTFAELGTGTQVIQGKTIGSGAIVGAGSVVIGDIPENCTAVGCPAKAIKFHGGN